LSRGKMLKRVARFRDLKGSDGGRPIARYRNANGSCTQLSVFKIQILLKFHHVSGRRRRFLQTGDFHLRGFNLGYCKASPGAGR